MKTEQDYWTIDAMQKYGGSFVQALSQLAMRADNQNLQKIKQAWPEYWAEYEKEGKRMEQEQIKLGN